MRGVPVACDVEPGADPRVVEGVDIVDEFFEGLEAAGLGNDATVKTDGHHLAFRADHVERVFQELEELRPGVETLGRHEPHVVVAQRVRNDQVRGLRRRRLGGLPWLWPPPVGQVVVVGVGVVEEAALFDDEVARSRVGLALVDAEGSLAVGLVDCDSFPDMFPFRGLVDVLIVDPPVAMRRDFPVIFSEHCFRRFWVQLQRSADREHRDGQSPRREQTMKSPEPRPRPVLVDRLHVHVPLPRVRRRPDDLAQ
mmetsp:Transcript_14048/g.45863  ORF Transcript_14048/g.45863 Transcript_14048/m.45863 type:complete len:253 (-) Transcript_14048:222-980(-)